MSSSSYADIRKAPSIALLAAVLASAVLAASLVPAARAFAKSPPCGASTTAPRRLTLHAMRTSVLCLINRVRDHYHLPLLAYNQDLRDSASAHSVSMVTHHYFGHEGPGGSVDSRISRAGYLARAHAFVIGENIGGGGGRRWGSPMAVFEEWMHSPPHRENMLDPQSRDAGVGVARGFPVGGRLGAATYTVDFGSRADG